MKNFGPQPEKSGEKSEKPEKADLPDDTIDDVPESVKKSKGAEERRRDFRVHNFEDVDVVLAEGVDLDPGEIADQFKDAKPRGWMRVSEEEGFGQRYISQDEKLFAKEKYRARPDNIRDDPEHRSERRQRLKERFSGQRNILNEFTIYKSVEEVVNSEEVQKMVQECGWKGVELIEPLAATVNKDNGKKFVIYKNVDAKNYETVVSEQPDGYPYINGSSDLGFFRDLKEYMLENQIEPIDYSVQQFLVPKTRSQSDAVLKLIDIEAYKNISEERADKLLSE